MIIHKKHSALLNGKNEALMLRIYTDLLKTGFSVSADQLSAPSMWIRFNVRKKNTVLLLSSANEKCYRV